MDPCDVTQWLLAWSNGDQDALNRLMPFVYEDLRRRARRYMNHQPPGQTLQATALVNEAFLKLVNQPDKHWQSRSHFLAVAAQAMHHILIDYARRKKTHRRGGEVRLVRLDDGAMISNDPCPELLALDEALTGLAKIDPARARLVEMRYFGGLTVEEIAKVLRVSPAKVMRDWSIARTWLLRELERRSA